MNTLPSIAVGTVAVLATGVSSAQSGYMMDGGMWDGGWMNAYGGFWVPILLVIVVAGLVAWVISRRGK